MSVENTDNRGPQGHLFAAPKPLSRAEALARLGRLVGQDLRPLADAYGVTVFRDGRLNKGWAGQTIEHYLGLPPNAAQAPDFGDWELKAVPLVLGRDLMPRLKETMSITMFEPEHLECTEFEDSHLRAKLGRIVVVARIYEEGATRSMVYGFAPFDLDGSGLYDEIREDYEEIRWMVRQRGLHALNGRIGRWVHPRPKGSGKGSITMGFYAHKPLLLRILGVG